MEFNEVYKVVEEQMYKDLTTLEEIRTELGLSISAHELIQYSGLVIGKFLIRKKHKYLKLTGILTGEKAGKEEIWIVKKNDEEEVKRRKFRRETKHLVNLKYTEENMEKLQKLISYWRRVKGLLKWLNEVRMELIREQLERKAD